jgi:L-lactate dehydrogenase complex protein LldE
MIKHHYAPLVGQAPVCERTYELCEFLVDVLQTPPPTHAFPHRVGIHQACHGLRELRLGSCSELRSQSPNKVRSLLESLAGIELAELARADECCGFGGTFAVAEEAVSVMMGNDRLDDHTAAGVQVIVSADMSCLMHLGGLVHRQRRPIATMHIAQVLAGRQPAVPASQSGEKVAT